MDELKLLLILDCKKCGASATAWGSLAMRYVYVECNSCGEHTEDFYYKTEEQEAYREAVERWNKDNG
jgi:uncharacterized Zn finger protein